MRRILTSVLILIFVFAIASSNAEDHRFTDVESGASFIIPTGWEEVPNVDGNTSVKIQYAPLGSAGLTSVALAVLDLYSSLGMSQYGIARKEIDFYFLDDDLVTAMLGPLEAKSNTVKKYSDYQFKVITTEIERTKAGLKFSFDCEMALTLVNGYVIMFQYMEMNHSDEYYAVYEKILESVHIQ